MEIEYVPAKYLIEVESLRGYINSFVGGRGHVRSMEGMIQAICQECADCIAVTVCARGHLYLEPSQEMMITCRASPEPEKAGTE